MPLFQTEVMICATVYIKAETAEQAAEKLQGVDTGLELSTRGARSVWLNEDLAVSGLRFDDTRLPDMSLSPAMTLHLMQFTPGPRLAAGDFEESN